MDILRAAQKGDPHPGSDRLGLDGKFGALLFELGDDPVDRVDTQADMLEPEIRRLRRGGHGLLGRNLRDENSYPSETEVEARPAVRLHRANDLGAEHVLVPAGGRLRIRAAQMDVVIGEGGHAFLPLIGRPRNSRPEPMPRPARSPHRGSAATQSAGYRVRREIPITAPRSRRQAPPLAPQEERDGCAGLFFLLWERCLPAAHRPRPQRSATGSSPASPIKSRTPPAPRAQT